MEQPILGGTYRDRVTGFEGVCIGRYDYLTGCSRITIQGRKLSDGGKVIELTIDFLMAEYKGISKDMKRLTAKHPIDPAAAG